MATRSEFVVLLLATSQILQVLSVIIHGIQLDDSNSDSYINIKSTRQHILRCIYENGYNDDMIMVKWYRDGKLVYIYNDDVMLATTYQPLVSSIATMNVEELQNINFKKISLKLHGSYVCEVHSQLGINRSEPFNLVVLDVPNENFETNVTRMKPDEDNNSSEELKNNKNNCTLLWDFKTPAIYPRPNITCGYYSYLHDDVVDSIGGGLTMQLLPNGSYLGHIEQVQIQISDIPPKERLGCSVSVPETSYKKVVKFEDSFVIDHLIDSEGCPPFPEETIHRRLSLTIEDGEKNCRDELIPTSNESPITINIRCVPNDWAIFSNGSDVKNWSTNLICDSDLKIWMTSGENGRLEAVKNISNFLPTCVPSSYDNNAKSKSCISLVLMAAASIVAIISNKI